MLRGYFLGVLKHITAWDRLWIDDETLKCGFKLNIRSSAFPCPALQHDSEYFYVTLEVYLTTLFSKIFCFSDFFGGAGRDRRDGIDRQTDRRTDGQTYGQTDFSQKTFRLTIFFRQIF